MTRGPDHRRTEALSGLDLGLALLIAVVLAGTVWLALRAGDAEGSAEALARRGEQALDRIQALGALRPGREPAGCASPATAAGSGVPGPAAGGGDAGAAGRAAGAACLPGRAPDAGPVLWGPSGRTGSRAVYPAIVRGAGCRGEAGPALAGPGPGLDPVPGIERIAYQRGLDTDDDGLLDRYATTQGDPGPPGEARLRALRVWMVLRAPCPGGASQRAIPFVDGPWLPPADGRLRLLLVRTLRWPPAGDAQPPPPPAQP